MYNSKKLRFIKEQEVNGLLSQIGIRTPLSKIPLLSHILFYEYKNNASVNKLLLAGDKFIREITTVYYV